MVFLYGNAVRVRNRLDSTGQIQAAARPGFGFTNTSLILQRYFNLYVVPIISDSRGVNLSIWLQIPVSVLQSIPHPFCEAQKIGVKSVLKSLTTCFVWD